MRMNDLPQHLSFFIVSTRSKIQHTGKSILTMNSAHRQTILVVDDDELVRTFMKYILKRNGYAVLLAEDGLGGIEVFRKSHSSIAAVVLDLTMPIMNGVESIAKIQEIRQDVPAILTSGMSAHAKSSELAAHPNARFIEKPFRPADFIALIEGACAVAVTPRREFRPSSRKCPPLLRRMNVARRVMAVAHPR
jgi:DNA-binding NtrC family response regulator